MPSDSTSRNKSAKRNSSSIEESVDISVSSSSIATRFSKSGQKDEIESSEDDAS